MDTNEPGPSNMTFEMSNPAAAARKRVKRITEEGTKIMRGAYVSKISARATEYEIPGHYRGLRTRYRKTFQGPEERFVG